MLPPFFIYQYTINIIYSKAMILRKNIDKHEEKYNSIKRECQKCEPPKVVEGC